MKEYQAPQMEVVTFEVNDVVTAIFSSVNLGEWDKGGENGSSSLFDQDA